MEAFGMIETMGLIAAIEATDTMLKSANVKFYSKEKIGSGRVTILITGDVGAVKSAVDAAVSAVEKIGSNSLISCHVIPRPSGEIFDFFGKPKEATKPKVESNLKEEEKQKPKTIEKVKVVDNLENKEEAQVKIEENSKEKAESSKPNKNEGTVEVKKEAKRRSTK